MITNIQIDQIELEKIIPEWFDNELLQVPHYKVFRYNYFGRRYYIIKHDDDQVEYAPSITSIIKHNSPVEFGLLEWMKSQSKDEQDFISQNSANYGTFMHALYNRLLIGDTLEFNNIETELQNFCESENEKHRNSYNYASILEWKRRNKRSFRKDLFGFVKWVQDYKVIPLAIEYPGLYRDEEGILQSVGLIDLVCKLMLPSKCKKLAGEVIAIVDYKTGFNWYENYQIQLHIYRRMWNDMFPEVQASRVFNLLSKNYRLPMGKTVVPYNFVDQTDSEKISMELLKNYFNIERLKGQPFRAVTEFKKEPEIKLSTDTKLNDLITSYNPLDKFTDFEFDKIKEKLNDKREEVVLCQEE